VTFVESRASKLWALGQGLARATVEALALKQAVSSGEADSSPISDCATVAAAPVQAPSRSYLVATVTPGASEVPGAIRTGSQTTPGTRPAPAKSGQAGEERMGISST